MSVTYGLPEKPTLPLSLVDEGEFFLDCAFAGLVELVGLGEDDLKFFLGVFFGELQDGLVELGFELQSGGELWGKAEIVEPWVVV